MQRGSKLVKVRRNLEKSSFAKVEKNSESSEESRDAMRMFCSDPPHDRDDGV